MSRRAPPRSMTALTARPGAVSCTRRENWRALRTRSPSNSMTMSPRASPALSAGEPGRTSSISTPVVRSPPASADRTSRTVTPSAEPRPASIVSSRARRSGTSSRCPYRAGAFRTATRAMPPSTINTARAFSHFIGQASRPSYETEDSREKLAKITGGHVARHTPSNTRETKAQILERVEREKVKFMRLQFTDILGTIKNVEIPDRQFEDALEGRIMFDGSSIEGFVRIEESDMYLRPDLATFRIFPWAGATGENVARMICDIFTPDGQPFTGDPRACLKKVIALAAAKGYSMMAGPEAEFFLFQTKNGVATTETHDAASYFDLSPVDMGEDVRREIGNALEAMGVHVEGAHNEVAARHHQPARELVQAPRAGLRGADGDFMVGEESESAGPGAGDARHRDPDRAAHARPLVQSVSRAGRDAARRARRHRSENRSGSAHQQEHLQDESSRAPAPAHR